MAASIEKSTEKRLVPLVEQSPKVRSGDEAIKFVM